MGYSVNGSESDWTKDQDVQQENEFVMTVNFDRDITNSFDNPVQRSLVRHAAGDWSCFFAVMNLDPVSIGSEPTYIWSNNFNE